MAHLKTHSTRIPAISICGASNPPPEGLVIAEELGRAIIHKGWTLICGGKGGIMEAACRGGQAAKAHDKGGIIVGIIPDSMLNQANPYCDIVIPTGLGYARNVIVALSGDLVVLIGGGAGTLSEAAYAWQFGKPIVALKGAGGWSERLSKAALDDKRDDRIMEAHSPQEVMAIAQKLIL